MSQSGLTKLLGIITERPFKVFKIIFTALNQTAMISWFKLAHKGQKNQEGSNLLKSAGKLG